MARQCGPIFLECTWDDLTFYQWEGRHFVRRKSSLTREKVLTHPAFHKTRQAADRLVTASKIASAIYNELPMHWRQFWMYRDFTGEAMTMIANGATGQQAYDYLWKTYVEYWVLYQQATGIKLKTGRKKQPARAKKTYATRLKHRTENPANRRYRTLIGRKHRKSHADNTNNLVERKRKRTTRRKQVNWLPTLQIISRRREVNLSTDMVQTKINYTRRPKRRAIPLKPPGKLVA